MDDQWSVLQSEKHDGALLNSSPHVPSRFGPQARAKPAWGSAFSMSETGRKCFQLGAQQSHHPRSRLDYETAQHWAWRKLITFALLLVSQFVGHRLCAHRRNVELRLDIDLVSVGDRINVLIIVLQMGCWELGD
jgi:hypothetical protein